MAPNIPTMHHNITIENDITSKCVRMDNKLYIIVIPPLELSQYYFLVFDLATNNLYLCISKINVVHIFVNNDQING